MPNLYDHGSGERMYGDLVRFSTTARELRHRVVPPERATPDVAAGVVSVGQPVPRLHGLRRHLRSGPDDPRRRPVDHAVVHQRRRAADRDQPVHDRRLPGRSRSPTPSTRSATTRTSTKKEPRSTGTAHGRSFRRQAGVQEQPQLRLRPDEPRSGTLDRPTPRRPLGRGAVQPRRRYRPPHPFDRLRTRCSASPARQPCAISGRTKTWDR